MVEELEQEEEAGGGRLSGEAGTPYALYGEGFVYKQSSDLETLPHHHHHSPPRPPLGKPPESQQLSRKRNLKK